MSDFLSYTHCYCEENVYRLLLKTTESSELPVFDRHFAVVFSNFRTAVSEEKANQWKSFIPYRPCSSTTAEDLTGWDYHVIAVLRCTVTKSWYVIDFDSKLSKQSTPSPHLGRWGPYCVALQVYLSKTFFYEEQGEFRHYDNLGSLLDTIGFRVMHRDDYVCWLRTDRSHMISEDGTYSAQPPEEPIIIDAPAWVPLEARTKYATVEEMMDPARRRNNLVSFINMNNSIFPGRIVNRHTLLKLFTEEYGQ